MQYFRDWEAAAKASAFNKAVSLPYKIDYHGKETRVEITMPLSGRPYHTPAGFPGIQLPDRPPTPKEIDAVRQWKRY